VSAHLLDANVLIALFWPAHEHHARVQSWFADNHKSGWATCPITQAAVIRILSNPAFSRDALSPEQAVALLDSNLKHPAHRFWPDEISVIEALLPLKQRLAGHQQITDAYLIGLARHHKGKLVTLDRGVPALLPENERHRGTVTVI
jgi:toxin-antitoxin system PIN domain toxin